MVGHSSAEAESQHRRCPASHKIRRRENPGTSPVRCGLSAGQPDHQLSITLSAVDDFAAIGKSWLTLEAESDGSFFQSWAWVGCLASERYKHPVLLELRCDGRPAALALFNRRPPGWLTPTMLHLSETGQPALDAVFVEHNGPLIARGQQHLIAASLNAASRSGGQDRRRGLTLSGVDDACLRAARELGGVVHVLITRPAPLLDFSRLGQNGFLGSLSANTRYQIRRSNQRYHAIGPLKVRRAASVAEGRAFLEALALLHQRSWGARGRPGAFANPDFRRFHHELVARALPAGMVDLLQITAGDHVIGYLYNFRFRGRVSAYQSGFDYELASPHQKPGLTCHHMAIEMYRDEGARFYDFLAGADRYKTSLSNSVADLHWIEVLPAFSLRGLTIRARHLARW